MAFQNHLLVHVCVESYDSIRCILDIHKVRHLHFSLGLLRARVKIHTPNYMQTNM